MPAEDPIIEYVGEVISDKEADQRDNQYSDLNYSFLCEWQYAQGSCESASVFSGRNDELMICCTPVDAHCGLAGVDLLV